LERADRVQAGVDAEADGDCCEDIGGDDEVGLVWKPWRLCQTCAVSAYERCSVYFVAMSIPTTYVCMYIQNVITRRMSP